MSELWSALRPRLERLTNPLPLAELLQADSHRAEIAPPLIAELEALAIDPTPAQADGYVLHLYAMLLLARWRDSRAYRPLAELGHLDESRVDTVFGQLVHDSYGRALASTCDGDLAPLSSLADDDSASAWARAAALEAMTLAALEGRCSRSPVVDFLADFGSREAQALKDDPERNSDFPLIDPVATHLADLGATEHLPLIREWFAAGLIDDSYVDATQLEEDIQRSPAAALASVREAGHGLIDDLMPEIALWPHIHHMPPVELPPIPLGTLREPIVREEAKVGRNDPCPCGSGRKYKKCHGAN
ncbi:DUF1186 domain-containing protein [Zoogloea sp.]|jgi:hypothetical protein|uniref:DUF1186 domain-containing protein n=1 Tax=Zoogloea sp. TaxID=49181 RepID=UPI0025E482AD|nr:DUF1186 domain-containing protein [Zoogloea sp.]MCK6392513.1 DUF1186 domain-containing protein [Zoogloea sp.]